MQPDDDIHPRLGPEADLPPGHLAAPRAGGRGVPAGTAAQMDGNEFCARLVRVLAVYLLTLVVSCTLIDSVAVGTFLAVVIAAVHGRLTLTRPVPALVQSAWPAAVWPLLVLIIWIS